MENNLKKYKAILIFGAPGSGKGTQAKLLAESNKGYYHFSTGDMFRQIKNNPEIANSEIGRRIQEITQGGNLVPDDLTIELFFKTLLELEKQKKFSPREQILILDGIPRNVKQAEFLKPKIEVKKIVYLHAKSLAVFAERIAKRAEIEGRMDDKNKEVVLNRLRVYEKETAPVLKQYAEALIQEIDALPTIEEIHKNIVKKLG